MFVKYTPAKSHIKVIPLIPFTEGDKKYTFDNDSIILRPGTNELTEQEWKAIQPHIKAQLGKEIVAFSVDAKPGKGGGKGKKAKCLKDVPVATARKIIQSCQDPNTLKKWFNQELPDEILLVLSKQMRKLKVEPDDIKDDDTEALKDSDITPEGSEVKTSSKTDTEDTEETTDDEDEEEESEEEDEEDEDIPDFDGTKEGGN